MPVVAAHSAPSTSKALTTALNSPPGTGGDHVPPGDLLQKATAPRSNTEAPRPDAYVPHSDPIDSDTTTTWDGKRPFPDTEPSGH